MHIEIEIRNAGQQEQILLQYQNKLKEKKEKGEGEC